MVNTQFLPYDTNAEATELCDLEEKSSNFKSEEESVSAKSSGNVQLNLAQDDKIGSIC